MFKKVCILSGNAHPELAAAIATFLETPLGKSKITRFSDGESFVEIGENVRGVDAFVIQPTCSPVNDIAHGAAHHVRRAPARLGRLDHGRHPVLRLRPAGPQGRAPHAHHEQARRGPPSRRGRHARRLDGPARRADPGLLQHPVRPPLRDARLLEDYLRKNVRLDGGLRLAGRRRGRARARVQQAAQRGARDHRQAPRAGQRERGDAPHRRRRWARTASSSTT